MKSYQLTVFFTPQIFQVEQTVASTKNVFFDQALLESFQADKDQALYAFGFHPGSLEDYLHSKKQTTALPSLKAMGLQLNANESLAVDAQLPVEMSNDEKFSTRYASE